MANKLVSIFHNNVPSRENTNQGVWDYSELRIGADNIVINQDGAGPTARLNIGARVRIADGTDAADAASKGQVETYVGTQIGALTASEGLTRLLNDFQIAAKGVTTAKINDKAVQTTQIDDKAVTATQIADATITVTQMANDAIETIKIKDLNVTTDKVALKAITYAQIADSTIAVGQMANNAIETVKIKDLNVTTDKIALKAVSAAQIADNTITAGQIVNNTITATQIADSTITVTQLANDAVETVKIKDLNVTTAKINAKAVTNAKIDDLAVATANIQLEAVTNSRIGPVSITTDKIATGGVQNSNIATGAVTGNKLNTAYRYRIGVNGDLTYEPYTTPVVIQASDTYPTAISKLDAAVTTINSSVPQQHREVALLGQTIIDVPLAMAFAFDDTIPDIEFTVNGKKQALGVEYNKTSTVRITSTYPFPAGADLLITKERTGGVPTVVNGIDVKHNGALIVGSATSINLVGAGVASVTNNGGGEVEVNITGGGGGTIDLSAVDQDIIPDANGSRSLGSVTKGWDGLYLTDKTTGDVYRLQIDNGFLSALLM
jgi:hypothetical protein